MSRNINNSGILIIVLNWDLFIKDTFISTIERSIFGALERVLCTEVVYMVSFIRRVYLPTYLL